MTHGLCAGPICADQEMSLQRHEVSSNIAIEWEGGSPWARRSRKGPGSNESRVVEGTQSGDQERPLTELLKV